MISRCSCVMPGCAILRRRDRLMMGGRGMIGGQTACPRCGSQAVRKDGLDRKGAQVHRCRDCRRCFPALTGTPFAGYRFPPDVIALAVRWCLRYRLSYADVAELLAERGVAGDPSSIYAWVQEFSPRYEDAARPFRRPIGSSWSGVNPCCQTTGQVNLSRS